MSSFHRKVPGKKPAVSKGPLPPCPKKQFIKVVQFQYFDNGERCGKGKSRYAMTIEVYCEDKFNICKPYWKRTASLLDPEQVMKWADGQMAEGKMAAADHEFYTTLYGTAEALMEDEAMQFVKIGYIEDRRSKIRYPGQVVLVTKELDGPMKAVLFTDGTNDVPACSDPLVFDKFSRPGSGRRLFFGFYDPLRLYAKTKAIAEKERAYLSGRPPVQAVEPDPFQGYAAGSPF